MKTYVLIISEFFPKTHSKAGQPTGFRSAIKQYEKIHTIRGNYDLWAKRFEKINKGEAFLSIRVWLGKPYKSFQYEILSLDSSDGIGIEKLEDPTNFVYAPIEGKIVNWDLVAQNDGISSEDFKEWFKDYDLSKEMAIIHFTRFRYSHLKNNHDQ
jgi:hypothetical protein